MNHFLSSFFLFSPSPPCRTPTLPPPPRRGRQVFRFVPPRAPTTKTTIVFLLFPPHALRHIGRACRVGYRMDDTSKVEIKAEMQLTRRYWRLLGGVSDAISRVCSAKVEATTLAVRLLLSLLGLLLLLMMMLLLLLPSSSLLLSLLLFLAADVVTLYVVRCRCRCFWRCFAFPYMALVTT